MTASLLSVPKTAVLACCLSRVACVAEALKIRLVIEEPVIASMRDDVVNVSGHHQVSFLEALLAMRMLSDESLAKLLPAVVVASIVCSPCVFHAATLTRLFGSGFSLFIAILSLFKVSVTEPLTARHGAPAPRKGTQSHQRHKNGGRRAGGKNRKSRRQAAVKRTPRGRIVPGCGSGLA